MKTTIIKSAKLYSWLLGANGVVTNLEHAMHNAIANGVVCRGLGLPRLGEQRLDHIDIDRTNKRVTFHDRGVDTGSGLLDNSYSIQG